MNRMIRATSATLVLISLSGTSWSKGPITRIVVDPMDAGTPIEITNPDILERFTVWSGPGVLGWSEDRSPDPGEPTFLIDWTKGFQSDLPTDLKHFRVTMYVGDREPPRNSYEVLYSIDSSAQEGYIYLPGPDDDSSLRNTSLIYRGVQGNWFRASQRWEAIVKPMLDDARNEKRTNAGTS